MTDNWLPVTVCDYQGQQSPPQWHAALVAALTLRSPHQPRNRAHAQLELYQPVDQYERALRDVHATVARALGVQR